MKSPVIYIYLDEMMNVEFSGALASIYLSRLK